ncbi:MAG: F0F1 ATP synthase subunit A [Candidatus Magnetoovum sp. WYHC-5]|nr:F0F1 ATP synthase subunit A [Candidatus Magnetoovum sp. WYHC-5]
MTELHPFISIPGIPFYVTYSWVAMAFLVGFALLVRRGLKLVPRTLQNVAEAIVEGLYNFCKDNLGHKWGRTFFPFLGSVFLYILVCNLFGLIPGFEAPTDSINTTAACALPVFLVTHYYGIKVHGSGYIKHFLGPMRSVYALPLMLLMFLVEVISHLARPVTLSIRLFGNMIAKYYLLTVAITLVPAFVPILILGLGLLVSVVQAFVFMLLSMIYFSGVVEEAH